MNETFIVMTCCSALWVSSTFYTWMLNQKVIELQKRIADLERKNNAKNRF
jgi:hypothetical protein